MDKKALAIVVGGGPAPGINGVISAATIEAIKHGHVVYGITHGFRYIMKRDLSCVKKLSISDVSRITHEGGSVLGTSRANPTIEPESLENVVESLKSLNVGYLVTIGGDDTSNSSRAIGEAAEGDIKVAHVPKTIDNDLPLPNGQSTFGFHSAREVGTEIVDSLMVDAKTTGRWYVVVAMGRKAGHLAAGIGLASGATVTLIPEEFKEDKVPFSDVIDIICASVIKRSAQGRPYGVVVLAEGLIDKIDLESFADLESAERDEHGHIRFAEIDLGKFVKDGMKKRLSELGVSMTVVDKDVGYELRCRPPIAFDRCYTRQLGFGVVDFLLGGGNMAMMTREDSSLKAVPFTEFLDSETNKTRLRLVDTSGTMYRVVREYMIRLTEKDLSDMELLANMATHTKLTVPELIEEFNSTAVEYGALPE